MRAGPSGASPLPYTRIASIASANPPAGSTTRAAGLLHPEIDFRAMTPNRIWEADSPAEVAEIFRAWLADPDEEVQRLEATAPETVEDTTRVGWRVNATDAEGPFVFEQQAYVRERDGQVGWLRVVCSGARPASG